MDLKPAQIIATGPIAGALGFGGMSIASAQEATEAPPTTTTSETPTAEEAVTEDGTAPEDDREGCDKDGDGVADESSDKSTDGG